MPNPASVLIADDQEPIREMLARQMSSLGHHIHTVGDGREALDRIRASAPDLVLLDMDMPEMTGTDVLAALREEGFLPHLPVIVVSGENDVQLLATCIEMGADDYLVKPYNITLLEARVGSSLERKRLRDQEIEYRRQIEDHKAHLEQRVREQVREITSAQLGTIFALSKLAESRDPVTGLHLERMREYCRTLSLRLAGDPRFINIINEQFVADLYIAAPLHDIGKVGIPDSILLKADYLTAEERQLMQTHTTIGADTLRLVDRHHPGNAFVRLGILIAESHHEQWDGAGYPNGTAGEEIPLAARILALCDVYDALTSRRCYKPPFGHDESRDIIVGKCGTHLDPALVEAFLEIEPEFIRIHGQFADNH